MNSQITKQPLGSQPPKPQVRALVVVPNPQVRRQMADLLSGIVAPEGVHQRGELSSTLDLLYENPFDFIVLDEDQGGVNVLQMVRDIKLLPVAEYASIILAAEPVSRPARKEAKLAGIDSIVAKPLTLQGLERALYSANREKMLPPEPSRLSAWDVLTRMRKVPLFSTFTEPELARLLKQCSWQKLEGGETIFRNGDEAHHIYVLISGRVEIRKGPNGFANILRALSPGACFGELAIIKDSARTADAVAVTDSLVFKIPRMYLENADHPAAVKMLWQVTLTVAGWISN